MSEQTYDEGRSRNLQELLRALAERIQFLDQRGALLDNAAELQKLLGDIRSELFHYEVRCTYDTPEIAEHKRIVADAKEPTEEQRPSNQWMPDEDADPTW
mgnify:FL=1